MCAWPGAPKSASSPPINPPSNRFPFSLSEHSTMEEVAAAVKTAYDGLTVHEQAFAAIPGQIAAQSKASAVTAVTEIISQETVTGVTAFNSKTGSIIYFPSLGMVNDQLGNPAYLTQNSDSGAKIIVGDSTPVAVTLNPNVMLPWFTIIGNDSSATAQLMPGSGASFFGLSSVYSGGFAFIYYDGTTFWSEGFPGGPTGTIPLGPLTDSGASGSISVAQGVITGWISPT